MSPQFLIKIKKATVKSAPARVRILEQGCLSSQRTIENNVSRWKKPNISTKTFV